jgi:probable rRNA maturation factor
MPLTIDIAIESDAWDAFPEAEDLATQAINTAIRMAQKPVMADAEISLLLTGDTHIRALNKEWRGKDKATNVLSFPACPPERLAQSPSLGDVVMAYDTLVREAADEQKSLQNHFSHLVVHGTLHLLGFDHEQPDEAEIMENLERQILAALGIPDPYSDTVALVQPHR